MADEVNWDDVRFFLAVLRGGSLRVAAEQLGVTQATVSRRLANLEASLQTELFERLPTGLHPTTAGEALGTHASTMAEEVLAMQRRAEHVGGALRVSAPEGLVTTWLMPHFRAFAEAHPETTLELGASAHLANLHEREAEVVIRLMNKPNEALVGRRVLRLAYAVYAAKDRITDDWIGWEDRSGEAEWIAGPFADRPVRHRVSSALGALHAARAGLGIARLACHLGDPDPSLERLSGAHFERWIWLLTHPGLRRNPRVRRFSEFMAERMVGERAHIESDATEWRTQGPSS
ncbi:MAG: LysR family transcriptional regulator [Myxococcota bacterium]